MPTPKKSKAKLSARNTTGYIGVTLWKSSGQYVAQFKGKKLGRFDKAIDAAKRYDEVAAQELGDKANLNFPVKK